MTYASTRLLFRPLEIKDAEELFLHVYSDENVNRYLRFETHKMKEETREVLTYFLENHHEIYVIIKKDTNEIIGTVEIADKSLENKTCAIGYLIGSKWWKVGYATESLKQTISFLFQNFDYQLIETVVRNDNVSSFMVCERNHMKLDGILRDRRIDKLDGHLDSIRIYSITRGEWGSKL